MIAQTEMFYDCGPDVGHIVERIQRRLKAFAADHQITSISSAMAISWQEAPPDYAELGVPLIPFYSYVVTVFHS